MKVSVTDVSACRRSLAVDLPPDVVEAEYEKAFRTFAKRIRLDGFRRGKVPKHVVEQKFGREIEQEAVEHLIHEYSASALEEAGLRPLHTPILKDYKFARTTGLSFVTEFEVRPRVSVSGYRGLRAERRDVEVSEVDVLKALDELRERAARFEPAEGRGVEHGDFVLADIRGSFDPGAGEPFSSEDAFFEVGSAGEHPELTDEIRGMRPGEERTFGVKYQPDHPTPWLAGRRVAYQVRLKETKVKRLPDLDDEFAKEIGSAETLTRLRDRVRAELLDAARRRERDEARRQVLDQLLDAHASVEVPEAMVDDQVEGAIEDAIGSMITRGIDPRRAGVDWDEVRKEQREPARRFVRGVLLLEAIAEKETLAVQPQDLDAAIAREAERRRQNVEVLRARWEKEGRVEALQRQILREKVLDFLLASANI